MLSEVECDKVEDSERKSDINEKYCYKGFNVKRWSH